VQAKQNLKASAVFHKKEFLNMSDNDTQKEKEFLRNVRRNKIKSIIAYTARTVALMCASGTLMQTFLATLGFDSELIYLHSTFLQAANVLTILLASNWASNGSPIKRSAFTTIPIGLLFLFYIPIAIANQATPVSYALLCAVGIVQQIAYGLFTVCEYKTPYYVYKADEYGMMLSICGIISSVFSLFFGFVVSFLTERFAFSEIMKFASGFPAMPSTVSVPHCHTHRFGYFSAFGTFALLRHRASHKSQCDTLPSLFVSQSGLVYTIGRYPADVTLEQKVLTICVSRVLSVGRYLDSTSTAAHRVMVDL
jgi:hypothetical protein